MVDADEEQRGREAESRVLGGRSVADENEAGMSVEVLPEAVSAILEFEGGEECSALFGINVGCPGRGTS